MERMMKVQEVILKAMAGSLKWREAAAAATAAGDAAAPRRRQTCLVWGWAVLRSDRDSGRCHQRDLLCAVGGGGRDADPDAGGAGGDRTAGHILRPVQRSSQRMERNYRTWQGRLPQELRPRRITTVEEANRFLRQEYRAEFNRRFAIAAAGKGSAFVGTRRKDLARVFSIQHERRVNPDNTIALDNRILQIEKSRWRSTLAGCNVRVYELLDGTVVVRFGPHEVARWAPGSLPAAEPKRRRGARPLGHQRWAA